MHISALRDHVYLKESIELKIDAHANNCTHSSETLLHDAAGDLILPSNHVHIYVLTLA